MPYHRLLLAVLAGNVAVLVVHLRSAGWDQAVASSLETLSDLTLVNLAAAVLIRQQAVLNALYGLAGRGSQEWPTWIRWGISKVHHIGGIHAGAAIAGTGWLGAFTTVAIVSGTRQPGMVTPTMLVICIALAALLVVVTACASPPVRMRAHNLFEQTHRWGGWAALLLFWILTIHLIVRRNDDGGVLAALASDWHLWVLTVLTLSIAWPWLRLRRVPITVHRPSSHVAIVHLDYGISPAYSSGVGISRHPLDQWHAFATISTPGQPGYRLVISRAGDWTGRFIDDPPTHLWVRGVPVVAPIAKVTDLYRRVVYVVTGSGIGPILGQLLADRVPSRLVWSTRDPRRTYGDALVEEVERVQPDAVIWDTTIGGKPDLVRLALDGCDDFDAEAVIVISNQPTTQRLVHQLERRGIPAIGPIWDS